MEEPLKLGRTVPMRDRESALPLYQQIRRTLESELASAEVLPNERFATEQELVERFSVSRMTVRRAVEKLVDRGLLYSVRGKGIYLREPQKLQERLSPLTGLFEDRTGAETDYEREIPIFEWAPCPGRVAETFDVAENSRVFYMRRIKVVNGVRLSIDHRYFAEDIGRRVETKRTLFREEPIRGVFKRLTIPVDGADITLEATRAGTHEIDDLGLAYGDPVLLRRITIFGVPTRPLVAGWSVARGDMYQYSLYVPFP